MLFLFLLGAFMPAHSAMPPIAKEIPHLVEGGGEKRKDPYFWLRERKNPAVLRYLNAENEYLKSTLQPAKQLREKLAAEMRSRMKENDSSYPFSIGDYFYYARYE